MSLETDSSDRALAAAVLTMNKSETAGDIAATPPTTTAGQILAWPPLRWLQMRTRATKTR